MNGKKTLLEWQEEGQSHVTGELDRLGIDFHTQSKIHLDLLLNMVLMRSCLDGFLRFLRDEEVMGIPGARYNRDIKTGFVECDDEEESEEF